MALSQIDAICTNCKAQFNGVPKRSFLGFRKLTCPDCHQKLLYPLTTGYHIIYCILCVLVAWLAINDWSQRRNSGAIIAAILVIGFYIWILLRSHKLKRQFDNLQSGSAKVER